MTFNYRGNPLVQQARRIVEKGDIGSPHFVHGHCLQDWLLQDTDFSWRLEPSMGGPSSALADIESHWCDLVEHSADCGSLRLSVRSRPSFNAAGSRPPP